MDNLVISTGSVTISDMDAVLDFMRDKTSDSEILQIVDLDLIVSIKQLELGVIEAIYAMRNNHMLSNSLSTEFLLRVSGNRQLTLAFKHFGVKQGVYDAALVYYGQSVAKLDEFKRLLSFTPKPLQHSSEKMKKLRDYYDLSEIEPNIEFAVLEKVAMLGLIE